MLCRGCDSGVAWAGVGRPSTAAFVPATPLLGACTVPLASQCRHHHTRAHVEPCSAASAVGRPTCRLAALGGHRATRAPRVVCSAYGRGRASSSSSDPNYYELLGLEPDCEEEDIKAAFRRRAKELHPDLNKEDGATAAFVELSRAYEVLSDPEARRSYDLTHRTRRMNFFRDVQEEDDDRSSPFQWSKVGRRQGGSGLRPDDDDEDGDDDEEGNANADEEGGGEEDEQGPGWQRQRTHEEFLEELAKVMGGGSLRNFQSGRLDPWGTSTSDGWFRQVERQTRTPYGPSRPGYGTSRDDDEDRPGAGGNEWDPTRRVPGWSPPGRGSEWNHPRRQWDDEEQRGNGPGRQGGGDFRRPFKI